MALSYDALRLNAFDVIAGSRVDFNHVALVHKDRRMELAARFNGDWLANVGRRVALGAGFAVSDFEFDVVGWSHNDRVATEESHLAIHVVFQVTPVVADFISGNLVLLESDFVHEHERLALLVQVLNIGFVNVSFFKRIVAFIGSVERGASEQVLHFANVESTALARFFEFHTRHDVWFVVDLDLQTFAKVAWFYCAHVCLPVKSF